MPPSAAYPPSGPLPLMAGYIPVPPPQLSQQYPTPGVAYAAYNEPVHMAYAPPHATPPQMSGRDPRDEEIARLTASLHTLAEQVRHLTHITGASPPPLYAMPLHVPPTHHNLHTPLSPRRPPSPTDSMASFATITSSSKMPRAAASVCGSHRGTLYSDAEVSEREADGHLLPVPAAAGEDYMHEVATRDEIFTSKELTGALACTGEPDAIAAWDVTFMGRLKSKNPVAHRVLLYTDAEIAAMPPSAQAVVRGYDSVLAGHLLAVLQADTSRVKLLRATVASREKAAPGTVTSSGRAIRGIILELISPMCGSELEHLELELEKAFFTMGMGEVAIKLAAKRYEALRAQLPPSARGGERELLRGLLAKFPEQLADDAKQLKKDMRKAEVTKKDYDWNYEQLTSMLASLVAEARPAAEANTTDIGRGGGGGENDRLLFTSGFKGCLHCGFTNHATRECTVPPCGYCGLRFCFANRKKGPPAARECLVKKVVNGGEVTDSDVGLNGRPLPPPLVKQINEKAQKLKAKANESNTTETQTEKNVIDSDDCVGESDHMELMHNVCC